MNRVENFSCVDEKNFQTAFTDFKFGKELPEKILPDDLIEAINDTRERKNLHGPFNTAEEAVASMLED